MKREVLIVGGGLAGIAAAAALALENHPVTLVERRRFLGGRASAFPTENGWLDNCQHVILGSCVNLLDLLEKLGTRRRITFYADIPFLADGHTTLLGPSPLPVPFHFLPRFLTARLFTVHEKLKILKLFAKLMKQDQADASLEKISLLEWLLSNEQSDRVIRDFWNLIFISSLNEDPDRASAKYGVMVLQESFLRSRDGALVGTPNVSLSELYHEAAETLFEKLGVTLVRSSVKAFVFNEGKPKAVLDNGDVLETDELISALPFYNLLPLLPDGIRDDPFFTRFKDLDTSPILGIHLWFDRKISSYPFGALSGSPIHWFFSKPPENDSHYVQLVISACRPFMDYSTEDLVQLGIKEINKYLPESRNANLKEVKVVREARATFSATPGSEKLRPPALTPVPHFHLAGDWTATGWPATMEGAVISGYRAAELILKKEGQSRRFELHHPRKGSPKAFTKTTVS